MNKQTKGILFLILFFLAFAPFENLAIGSYSSDPKNLADGLHILFVDQNNPNCSDSYARTQAFNPATPWCGTLRFKNTCTPQQGQIKNAKGCQSGYSALLPGDTIYFKAGIYTGGMWLSAPGTANNYISFQPYPGDPVTINFGQTYNGWVKDPATGYWNANLSYYVNKDYPALFYFIEKNNWVISNTSNLSDLTTSAVNLVYWNGATGQATLKLISSSENPNTDIFVASNIDDINVGTAYNEIKGFTVQYGGYLIRDNGASHTRIINNTIRYGGQGIMGSDYLLAEGNNITYCGASKDTSLIHGIYADANGIIIRNNYMNYISGQSLQADDSTSNAQIYNNNFASVNGPVISGTNYEFYNNIIGGSIAIYPSKNMRIYNNLFNNGLIEITYPQNGLTFKNNIVKISNTNSYSRCLQFDWDGVCSAGSTSNCNPNLVKNSDAKLSDYAGLDFSNNIYYGCSYLTWMYSSGLGLNKLSDIITNSGNPNFENGSFFKSDPKLDSASNPTSLLSESPAISNGTCMISTDYYNKPRSAVKCSIGPFEPASSANDFPAATSIGTNDSNASGKQALIQALLKQIAELKDQLAQMLTSGQSNSFCYDFNNNIAYGDTVSDDAKALAKVIALEGVTDIAGLQEKYASDILNPVGLTRPTGFVGARTRLKLNALYACSK